MAVTDYPLQTNAGLTDSFKSIPRTPPLNLAAFVLQVHIPAHRAG